MNSDKSISRKERKGRQGSEKLKSNEIYLKFPVHEIAVGNPVTRAKAPEQQIRSTKAASRTETISNDQKQKAPNRAVRIYVLDFLEVSVCLAASLFRI